MYEDPTGYRNSSGAPDPTAYRAARGRRTRRRRWTAVSGCEHIFYALARARRRVGERGDAGQADGREARIRADYRLSNMPYGH